MPNRAAWANENWPLTPHSRTRPEQRQRPDRRLGEAEDDEVGKGRRKGRPLPRSPWSTRSASRYHRTESRGFGGNDEAQAVVFVCKDLESNAKELCETLGIDIAYRDPGVGKWGLANVVCPTGHDFLEIVSPTQEGTSAGRYIQRRKGDGGYMVIIQVARRGEGTRAHHRARRPRGREEGHCRIQVHALPSVRHGGRIAVDRPDRCAGGHRREAVVAASLDGLAAARPVQHHQRLGRRRDPGRRSRRGGGAVVEDPEPAGRGDIIRLDDDGEIRFVPIADDRGPGVSAYDIKAVDRDAVLARAHKRHHPPAHIPSSPGQIELCGCRINLV